MPSSSKLWLIIDTLITDKNKLSFQLIHLKIWWQILPFICLELKINILEMDEYEGLGKDGELPHFVEPYSTVQDRTGPYSTV